MKKIVIALLAASLLVGAFFVLHQPEQVTASPGDFLPRPGDERATMFLQAHDMSALGEVFAEKSEFVVDLLPPEERFYLEAFAFKMREVAPHFGESFWLASFEIGKDVPDLTASFAVKAEDPRAFLEDLFSRVLEKFPTYTMEKLEADLPDPALPLMRIQDSQSGLSVYTALFSPETSPILLASTSRQGLRGMVEAFESPEKRFSPDREVEGAVFLGLSLSPEVLREMEVLPGTESGGTLPLKVQFAFDGDGKSLTGKIFSNASSVMATAAERDAQKPLGENIPFVGEGTLIGFSSGRLSGLTEETVMAQIRETPDAEDVLDAIAGMEQITGLTVKDIVDLLNGRVSFALGGGALTPVGEVPGAYLLFEPDKTAVAFKVAHAILGVLPFTLKPEKSSQPGWAEVYGIDAMATFTLAVDEHRLLVGLLDAGQMGKTPLFPEPLQNFLSPGQYGALGLSFVELEKAADGLARRLALLLHDPRVKQGIETFHRVVAPLDTLTIEATSPERGNFRLIYREQAQNKQEVQ